MKRLPPNSALFKTYGSNHSDSPIHIIDGDIIVRPFDPSQPMPKDVLPKDMDPYAALHTPDFLKVAQDMKDMGMDPEGYWPDHILHFIISHEERYPHLMALAMRTIGQAERHLQKKRRYLDEATQCYLCEYECKRGGVAWKGRTYRDVLLGVPEKATTRHVDEGSPSEEVNASGDTPKEGKDSADNVESDGVVQC